MASKILEGIARDGGGLMHIVEEGPTDTFTNGIPITNDGIVGVDSVAAITGTSRGLPFVALGFLAIEFDVPVIFVNGWPLTAAGRIAVGSGPVTEQTNAIPLNANGEVAITELSPT
jgi:hypothetical protein